MKKKLTTLILTGAMVLALVPSQSIKSIEVIEKDITLDSIIQYINECNTMYMENSWDRYL